MIIVKRKIIIYSILIICTGVVLIKNINVKKTGTVQQVMSQAVDEKVVIVDAGHGGEDGGAVSKTGISEANINLQIALKLQELLEQTGITVVLTRSTDEAIYDIDKTASIRKKKKSDLQNRVKIGNESSADLFVSIHLNKIEEEQYDGWQTFYKENDKDSKEIAESIQNNLNQAINKQNNRIAKSINNIYIVKNIEIPITIVECGFLSNNKELEELQNDKYQEKLAWGIYNGIIEWMR